MTSRRLLRCPTTEAYAAHIAHLKQLASSDAVAAYLADLRRREGLFLAKWVRDDFATQWAAMQRKVRKAP